MSISGARRNDSSAKSVARRASQIIQKSGRPWGGVGGLLSGRGAGGAIFLTAQSGVCGRLLATNYARALRAGVDPPPDVPIMAHVSGYFREFGPPNVDERRVSGILRAGAGYRMRLLEMESGVEGSVIIESAHT